MAGRRQKVRNVGAEPEYLGFSPDGPASGRDITLAVDELEALRLVDLEHLSQAAPAQRSRRRWSTVGAWSSPAATSPMPPLRKPTPSLGRQRRRAP